MSADLHSTYSMPTPGMFANDGEITPYLEALASRLRHVNPSDETDQATYTNMIDRVLAYAASAEQHIAEQQMRIRELEDISTTDELTGLNNRRALKNYLTRALSSARRYGDQGIVAFLDLNHFKDINDTHGHKVGDKLLQHLANVLQGNLRDTDFVARLGGDEFVFVLEKADIKLGLERAEKIREIVNNSSITVKGKKIKLSASMGVTIYNPDSDYDTLIHDADIAMYDDKKAMRRSRL